MAKATIIGDPSRLQSADLRDFTRVQATSCNCAVAAGPPERSGPSRDAVAQSIELHSHHDESAPLSPAGTPGNRMGPGARWLAHPLVWIPAPTAEHAGILGRLVTEELSTGELIMDAHLAALAIEHGLTLCSTDRDFARFTGLKWRNPIAEQS